MVYKINVGKYASLMECLGIGPQPGFPNTIALFPRWPKKRLKETMLIQCGAIVG